MKFLIILWGLYLSLFQAQAHTADEFCTSFVSLKSEQKPTQMTLKKWILLQLYPSSVIDVKGDKFQTHSLSSEPRPRKEDAKFIFVNLPRPQVELTNVMNLKLQEKVISKLPIMKELKKVVDVKSCLQAVDSHAEDFDLVKQYLENYFSHAQELSELKDQKLFEKLIKKLKVFERLGWKVVFPEDLYDFYKFLAQNPQIQQVMLIAHSDHLGRLYDAKKNIFPKGAFANLGESLKKFILYSCHGETVSHYYLLAGIDHKIAVYYPKLKEEYQSLLADQVPVTSILGMREVTKMNSWEEFAATSRCTARINLPNAHDHLFVSLNDQLLGVIHSSENSLSFDCRLIGESINLVKVYYMGSITRSPLSVSSIRLINEQGQSQELSVKEYLSKNNDHHLLTLGTSGGLH